MINISIDDLNYSNIVASSKPPNNQLLKCCEQKETENILKETYWIVNENLKKRHTVTTIFQKKLVVEETQKRLSMAYAFVIRSLLYSYREHEQIFLNTRRKNVKVFFTVVALGMLVVIPLIATFVICFIFYEHKHIDKALIHFKCQYDECCCLKM